VRVVSPNSLMRDVAPILDPIRDEVVVIGALAVQIALDGHDVAFALTSDVDAGVGTESVPNVVGHLEESGLRRSSIEHERSFTWVKDEIKVQLIRPFHPFPKGAARGLPTNNMINELADHRWLVSFDDDPERGRFWAAGPAALVALKEEAFGRKRPTGEPVDRDFSDVALLLDRLGDQVAAEVSSASQMRKRVVRAAERLDEEGATAAARELVGSGQEETQAASEAYVRRTARDFLRLVV
jgi:hypothetical protein